MGHSCDVTQYRRRLTSSQKKHRTTSFRLNSNSRLNIYSLSAPTASAPRISCLSSPPPLSTSTSRPLSLTGSLVSATRMSVACVDICTRSAAHRILSWGPGFFWDIGVVGLAWAFVLGVVFKCTVGRSWTRRENLSVELRCRIVADFDSWGVLFLLDEAVRNYIIG